VPESATPNDDFIPREGWIRFATNENVKVLTVPVLGDTLYEPSGYVSFDFVDRVALNVPTSTTGLTILNDDLPPRSAVTIDASSAGELRLYFGTVPGATYLLQTRTNLTADPWRTIGPSVVGDGGQAAFTLPNPIGPEHYFRIRAQ
jgi:hypothetical protein